MPTIAIPRNVNLKDALVIQIIGLQMQPRPQRMVLRLSTSDRYSRQRKKSLPQLKIANSQVVLSWIKTDLTKLDTYVANRVKVILQHSAQHKWLYVRSADNPADCLSREFQVEMKALRANKQIKGSLQGLHVFIDKIGTLRVGGRLQNAMIPLKAVAAKQLMGSLPSDRVNPSRPFEKVGVDYCGPISIKQSRVRRSLVTKGYIAVFVCFVTKAVHLELVSDLRTDTFLACFKRFIARRNKPTQVYCDNASTFKGAKNQLDDLYRLFNSQTHQSQVQSYAANLGINFNFIPSYSPVFGSLWEAAVKSTKHHLKRVVERAVLTYEELNTVLVQIEGVLNSRPLTPMSPIDKDDFSFLTPGHFLTGAPLNSYPEQDVSSTPTNRLKFWKLCTSMQQQFWKAWSQSYLNMLQNRPKWKQDQPNIKPDLYKILEGVCSTVL
ncbi:uncharacterized protein [Choristoneura fumiferana]|uniref:uncharacterized protein n=1 Tax=Choristoneura fumiferana TaxID=7141 RepID=UPI003D153A59